MLRKYFHGFILKKTQSFNQKRPINFSLDLNFVRIYFFSKGLSAFRVVN